MPVRSSSLLGRAATAARQRPALLRITVSPPVARFLIAAGARPAPDIGNPAASFATHPDPEQRRELAIAVLMTRQEFHEIDAAASHGPANRTRLIGMLVNNLDYWLEAVTNASTTIADDKVSRALAEARANARQASLLIETAHNRLQAHDEPGAVRHMAQAMSLIARIRQLLPAPNLAATDLRKIHVFAHNLAGATWTNTTVWRDQQTADRARAVSDEISPGHYRIAARLSRRHRRRLAKAQREAHTPIQKSQSGRPSSPKSEADTRRR